MVVFMITICSQSGYKYNLPEKFCKKKAGSAGVSGHLHSNAPEWISPDLDLHGAAGQPLYSNLIASEFGNVPSAYKTTVEWGSQGILGANLNVSSTL